MDTKSLRQEARKHNVDFHQGSLFSHNKELKNYLRLAFALYDEDVLAEGARRLGKVILENLS